MTSRKGSLLEKDVARILSQAGFDPELNKELNGYEIDVYLEYRTLQVAFECKQYERSTLNIRNLIHQWDSKNKRLELDKIVLVLVGVNVGQEHRRLAEEYGIEIWGEEKLDELLDRAIEEKENVQDEVLMAAGLESTDEIKERVKDVAAEFDVPDPVAECYLKGEITENEIREAQDFVKSHQVVMVDFSPREYVMTYLNAPFQGPYSEDFKLYGGYGGSGVFFRDVVSTMDNLDIEDKRMARLFVNHQPGRIDDEAFSETRLRKMRFLLEEHGYPLEKAKDATARTDRMSLEDFRQNFEG